MIEAENNQLTGQEVKILIDRYQPKIKTFNRNEVILRSAKDNNLMGVIINGMAYLATINLDYQKRIIDYYEANDIFCSRIIPVSNNDSYYIYANTKCTVALIDYREFIKDCDEAMIKLKDYLITNCGRRSIIHIDILSQRTLRNKLLCYFDYCCKRKKSASYTLPISLSELADYLAVDRSAMMRELSRMKDEKIVISTGRKITLLTETSQLNFTDH